MSVQMQVDLEREEAIYIYIGIGGIRGYPHLDIVDIPPHSPNATPNPI